MEHARFVGRLFRRSVPTGMAFLAIAVAIGFISVLHWALRLGASAEEEKI